MSNFSSVSIAFVVGVAVAASWTTMSESALVREAKAAEGGGRTINNEMMMGFYPRTYRAGYPEYLERDFEAGADMICDEILLHYERDICAALPTKWR